jgi:predicted Zn-dependent protease
MHDSIKQNFQKIIPNVDFCSLRYFKKRAEELRVRRNVVEPPSSQSDVGAMLMVIDNGGLGYAATSDLTEAGLREAVVRAQRWAEQSRDDMIIDFSKITMPNQSGEYTAVVKKPWHSVSIADKLD